ncbi:S8 family peptidase [Nocardioides panacisoli]|uniref:S8/S53 family peptidase n=1 Tax=Nocardioides panacisoli TaxID=627624 RepID=A0ABP7IL17_9ACTN
MSESDRNPVPISRFRVVLNRLRFPWDWIRRDPGPTPGRGDGAKDDPRERLRVQVGVVRDAMGGDVATAGSDGAARAEDDADTAYLFRPGHALVRDDETFERLDRFFGDRQDTYAGRLDRVPDRAGDTGILVRLPSRRDERDDVLATLDEVDDAFRPSAQDDPDGYRVYTEHPVMTPDHLLYVTATGHLCPATEPQTVRTDRPWPDVNPDETAGEGIRVSVVDTGLWLGALDNPAVPWMDGVVPASPLDEEVILPPAIHPYGGHGTFVAGVIQCMAPASRVEVEGALTHGGAVYESDICLQLHQALTEREHPQIISISAGTHTRKNMALLGFDMLAAAHGLDDGEDTIVVAAAGNDGSTDPFWPAAFPWVVGVGSVDSDGKMSDYSNHGEWVDVYARGRDLVNAFPTGTYTCYEPPNKGQVRQFKNLAQWSGTSFSTPVVTGLIAARMSAAGENAQQARAAVLKGATTTGGLPIVGPLT